MNREGKTCDWKADVQAAGEAGKAIFWRALILKEEAVHSSLGSEQKKQTQ